MSMASIRLVPETEAIGDVRVNYDEIKKELTLEGLMLQFAGAHR
jgi:hypothetical protein